MKTMIGIGFLLLVLATVDAGGCRVTINGQPWTLELAKPLQR